MSSTLAQPHVRQPVEPVEVVDDAVELLDERAEQVLKIALCLLILFCHQPYPQQPFLSKFAHQSSLSLYNDSELVEFDRTPGVSISLIKSLCSFVLMYVLVSTVVSPQ